VPHDLACRCGAVRGFVERDARANHMVCYCADCQDYAHILARPDILDERGGTEVVQTMPKFVTVTQGADRLACLRMTEKGPLRWCASCCNTPIGNTALTHRIAFVGLVAACLTGRPVEETFGPVAMWGCTAGAKGAPKPPETSMRKIMARIVPRTIVARLDGSYRKTPFFDVETGRAVAEPRLVGPEERVRLAEVAGN
jgi:hypothetical protein